MCSYSGIRSIERTLKMTLFHWRGFLYTWGGVWNTSSLAHYSFPPSASRLFLLFDFFFFKLLLIFFLFVFFYSDRSTQNYEAHSTVNVEKGTALERGLKPVSQQLVCLDTTRANPLAFVQLKARGKARILVTIGFSVSKSRFQMSVESNCYA